jgi:hypothetical protein
MILDNKFALCDRNCRSLIYYILVNKNTAMLLRDTSDVYRAAGVHSDHFLVIEKLALPKR